MTNGVRIFCDCFVAEQITQWANQNTHTNKNMQLAKHEKKIKKNISSCLKCKL